MEITSFTYEFNQNKGNIFKFYGNSLNKKEIRNIGSSTHLVNFNINFNGGYYYNYIQSKCFLYKDGSNHFVIQCYLKNLINDDIILSSVGMEKIFINEQNNEYDIILPFEFALNMEIKKWEKFDYEGKEYYDYSINIPEINSKICNNLHAYDEDNYICEYSKEENKCIERNMKCEDKKSGATVYLCHELNYKDVDNSKVCVKEGDSCIKVNSCSKVKFYSENICEKLLASSKDNICIKSGEECREINAEKYKNRNNIDIDENRNNENKNEEKNDGITLSLSFVILSVFFIL